MNRHRILHRIATQSRERQIMALSSIVTAIACFLPWYGINSRVINEWWNAFDSIGSVGGYIVVGFSLAMLTLLTLSVIRPDIDLLKRVPISEEALMLFLSAQSAFVVLMFIPIYSQYALINATNSGTRFGIYVALAGAVVSSIASLSAYRKQQRAGNDLQEFATVPRVHQSLHQEEEDVYEEESDHQETIFEAPATEPTLVADNVAEEPFRAAYHAAQNNQASSDQDFDHPTVY